MLSKKLQLFIQTFKNNVENSQQSSPWFAIGEYKGVENEILNKIHTELSKIGGNSCNIYHNNVRNQIDINKNEVTQNNIQCFIQIDFLEEKAQRIINNNLNLILDNNCYKSYIKICYLLIPVLEYWSNNHIQCHRDIQQFNSIVNKYTLEYIPGMNLSMYYNKIKYYKDFEYNDIISIINFLLKIKKQITQPIRVKNNTSFVQTQPVIIENNNIKSVNTRVIDLHKLKKDYIIEFCGRLNINTSGCRLKADYIKKLEPHKHRINSF